MLSQAYALKMWYMLEYKNCVTVFCDDHSHTGVTWWDKINCFLLSSLSKWGWPNPIKWRNQQLGLSFPFCSWAFGGGRCSAQLVGIHQSLVQSNLKRTSVWYTLSYFFGLENDSVFSWWTCYIAQVAIIQTEGTEDVNVGLLFQRENRDHSDCFCSSGWIQWDPKAASYFNSPGERPRQKKVSLCTASFFQCFLLLASIGLSGCVLSQLFFIQIPVSLMH